MKFRILSVTELTSKKGSTFFVLRAKEVNDKKKDWQLNEFVANVGKNYPAEGSLIEVDAEKDLRLSVRDWNEKAYQSVTLESWKTLGGAHFANPFAGNGNGPADNDPADDSKDNGTDEGATGINSSLNIVD